MRLYKKLLLLIIVILSFEAANAATITVDSIIHMKVSCNADTNAFTTGAIYISHNVAAPATYSWTGPNSFTATTADITSLSDSGQYTLTVKRFGLPIVSKTISLGYSTNYGFFTASQEVYSGSASVDLKNIVGNSWCRGAGSKNILADSTDGWIEFLADVTNKHRLIGLSSYSKTSSCWGNLDYGIYLKNNGDIRRVVSGTETSIGTYVAGDLIRVSREDDTIKFYQNNTDLGSSVSGVTLGEMHADVSVYGYLDILKNLACSFKPPFEVDIDVTNISCGDTIGGSISLNPCGDGPFTYSWSPSGDTTSSIDSLEVGEHTVTIEDTTGWMVKRKISVGYDAFWANQNNATYTFFERELEKTSGSSTSWDAGGNTYLTLPGSTDGWIEYEVIDTDKERIFGLSKNPSTDHGLDSLDYGFVLQSDAYLKKNVSGTFSNTWGTYKKGDILKMERIGSTLYFHNNEYQQGTLSVTAGDAWYGECSFYSSNGLFENVRTSINCPSYITSVKGVLKEKVEAASSYHLVESKVRFNYYEKYKVDTDKVLAYNIYDESHSLIAGVDADGNELETGSPQQAITYGHNACELDLRSFSLTAGEYILEVISPKNDKTYLRFKL